MRSASARCLRVEAAGGVVLVADDRRLARRRWLRGRARDVADGRCCANDDGGGGTWPVFACGAGVEPEPSAPLRRLPRRRRQGLKPRPQEKPVGSHSSAPFAFRCQLRAGLWRIRDCAAILPIPKTVPTRFKRRELFLGDENFPFSGVVGLADNAFFFHPLHQGRRAVIADLQPALDVARGRLAVAFDDGDRLP